MVDGDGSVIAIVPRAEMRRRVLRHRTVFVAVMDPAGERLLVHRRASWKDVWPMHWDVAFGGVVGVGETWDLAAARELAEEAGVAEPLIPLGEGTYDDDHVAEVARIYLVRSVGPFTFADGEVESVEWVDRHELPEWLAGRAVCPDGTALVLPRLPAARMGSGTPTSGSGR